MPRSAKVFALLMCSAFGLAGCTNRDIYETVQNSNRLACQEQPPSQYDDCMERSSVPYEDYERAREEDAAQEGLDR